jgi:hypothetical protein
MNLFEPIAFFVVCLIAGAIPAIVTDIVIAAKGKQNGKGSN